MEFNEKLRELRTGRSLTQEELAGKLFVSRTAISKWESGRGYPSIDSLREISRYFGVTVDELICPAEIIDAARQERQALASTYVSLACGALDTLVATLLVLPAFGNGTDEPQSVQLMAMTGVSPYLRWTLLAMLLLTAINGVLELVVTHTGRLDLSRRLLTAGCALSVLATMAFIATRQPYAGIVCFSLLVAKALLVAKGR